MFDGAGGGDDIGKVRAVFGGRRLSCEEVARIQEVVRTGKEIAVRRVRVGPVTPFDTGWKVSVHSVRTGRAGRVEDGTETAATSLRTSR